MSRREKATAERRPFQFSLRALLVFVLVASAGLGVRRTLAAEAQEQAQLARFTELGFDVIFGRNGEVVALRRKPGRTERSRLRLDRGRLPPKTLRLQRSLTDGDLIEIGRLTGLRQLELSDAPITDAGLADLQSLDALQRLDLGGTRITDAGLAHLAGMVQLRALSLQNTRVSDTGLVHLHGLTRLEELDVRMTRPEHMGLPKTRPEGVGFWVTPLEGLDLRKVLRSDSDLPKTQVTPEGLRQFGIDFPETRPEEIGFRVTPLESLDLRKVLCNDPDAWEPAVMPGSLRQLRVRLGELRLENPGLSDPRFGIPILDRRKVFRDVSHLRKTRVTSEGLRQLKKALPGVNISVGKVIVPALLPWWRHRTPRHVLNDDYEVIVLDFSHAQTDRTEFQTVKALHNIYELDLRVTLPVARPRRIRATDAVLAHLEELVHLEVLNLAFQTDISDAGLKHLTGMRNLRLLNLADTRVTDDGVRQLQRALPQTVIVR